MGHSKMRMAMEFENQSKTYHAGQTVTGRLVVELTRDKKFRSINIVCEGEAHVRFSKSRRKRRGRRRRHNYTGEEKYFKNNIMVAGGASGETELPAGTHYYNFSFPLPQNIPSSFEGTCGYIRYTIKAKMDRSWKIFGSDYKTNFTVLSPVDLNTMPIAKEPVFAQKSKAFFLRSGTLQMTVQLPCSGYVPGQTISFNIDVNNTTSVLVTHLHCSLYKETRYTASSLTTSRQKTETDEIVNVKIDESVEPHTSKTLHQSIKIPPVPPSDLHNCSIIDLNYFCVVEAHVEGIFHQNLEERIPITVGTVPLYNKIIAPPAIGFSTPIAHQSTAPSAPPAPYPELPPPSYEESVYGIQVTQETDDGESTTNSAQNFFPRYPVWSFDQKK